MHKQICESVFLRTKLLCNVKVYYALGANHAHYSTRSGKVSQKSFFSTISKILHKQYWCKYKKNAEILEDVSDTERSVIMYLK